MEICLDFPGRFAVEEAPELPGAPGTTELYYYPGASQTSGRDGILLKISPEGRNPWIGCFAFEYPSPPAITVVAPSPSPDELCVVARGAGYVVRVDNPLLWQAMPCFPVLQFRSVPSHRLLIFGNHTRLIAYGASGIVWKSQHLSDDGLTILSVEGHVMELLVRKVDFASEVQAQVDIRTGREIQ